MCGVAALVWPWEIERVIDLIIPLPRSYIHCLQLGGHVFIFYSLLVLNSFMSWLEYDTLVCNQLWILIK